MSDETQNSKGSLASDANLPATVKTGRPPAPAIPDLNPEITDELVMEYGIDAFQLDDDDLKVLACKIKYPRCSAAAISRATGINEKKVQRSMRSPEFIREYNAYYRYTADSMKDAARIAAARLLQLVNSPNEKTALRAISIALSPYIQQAKVQVDIKPNVTFRTNVTQSGNLVREVIEGEIELRQTATDSAGTSAANPSSGVEED